MIYFLSPILSYEKIHLYGNNETGKIQKFLKFIYVYQKIPTNKFVGMKSLLFCKTFHSRANIALYG